MNDGYLDAECVINGLVSARFIHAAGWKHAGRERSYPASFWLATGKSLVSFWIVVIDEAHKIPKSSLRLHAQKYHKDFSALFENCAV